MHKQSSCYKIHSFPFRYIPRGFQGFFAIWGKSGLWGTVIPCFFPSSFCFGSSMAVHSKENFFFLIANKISIVVFFISVCQSAKCFKGTPILEMGKLRHRFWDCPQPLRKPVAENEYLSSPSCWHFISALCLSKPSLVFAVHPSLRSSHCSASISSCQKSWKLLETGSSWKSLESTHFSLCNCPCCWQECGCDVCVLNACGLCPRDGVNEEVL